MQPVSLNKSSSQPTNPKIFQSPIVVLFKQVMANAFKAGLAFSLTVSAFYAYYRPIVTILHFNSMIANIAIIGTMTMTTVLSIGYIVFIIKACSFCLQKKPKRDVAQQSQSNGQAESKQRVETTQTTSGQRESKETAANKQVAGDKIASQTVQQSGSASTSSEVEEKEYKEKTDGEDELIEKMKIADEQERAQQVIEHINSYYAVCMSLNFLDQSVQKRTQEVFELLKAAINKYPDLQEDGLKAMRWIAIHFHEEYVKAPKPILFAQAYQFASEFECNDIEMLHICMTYLNLQAYNNVTMSKYKETLDSLVSEDIENHFLFAECYYILAVHYKKNKSYLLIPTMLETAQGFLNEYSTNVRGQSDWNQIKDLQDRITNLKNYLSKKH